MCGIAGILKLDGASVESSVWTHRGSALTTEMANALGHRGPDDHGYYVDGPCAIAHTRLSIIDLSEAGHQPMPNEDGTLWLVFNGEIYSSASIRVALEDRSLGHVFRSRTDSEVILHLYEDHGTDCLRFLRGMFAFALWDSTKRLLLLARDRLGVKPLTYQVDRNTLRFASEAKAILADPAVERAPNLQSISHYLTFGYVPSPMSAFQGFRQLPPAHYIVVRDGKVESPVRYWDIDRTRKHSWTVRDTTDGLLDHLKRATSRRLVSDVPVGVLLSGGIDSSAVVWAMSKHVRPTTFCMAFDDPALDERHAARIVARHFNTDHHEFTAPMDPTEMLPRLVEHYDEPFADSSAVPTFLLAEQVSKHVKVVLTGDGGDEAFGGYLRYPYFRMATRLSARSNEPNLYAVPFCMFHGKRWEAITTEEFKRSAWSDGIPFLACRFQDSTGVDSTDRAMDVDTRLYLPDDLCVKMDRATMAHGLEARSPFLDVNLVEFAASIPSVQKVAWRKTKRILKQALEPHLPREILTRPKQGFGAPVGAWFRGPLFPIAQRVFRDAKQRGWIDPQESFRLLADHMKGVSDHGTPLWYLLILELWAQRWIDQ